VPSQTGQPPGARPTSRASAPPPGANAPAGQDGPGRVYGGRHADPAYHGSPSYGDARYGPSAAGYGADRRSGGSYRAGIPAPQRSYPARTPPDARRGTGGLMTVLGCLAIAALLGVLGVGGYVAFFSARSGTGGQAPASHDIGSQQADPVPLTVSEVFPGATVTPTRGGQAYQLAKSQGSADCRTAVVGDLAGLLSAAGCTQVVRATFTSPDKAYVVTAGIFNMRDEAAARQAADGIQASVKATKGRFTGYPAGGATDVIGRAATRLGWDTLGHFLVYGVVARADGAAIADQATIRPIIDDLVEKYLKDTVVHARTLAPGPSAT
jgi:hypothetical protein